jgi:hypothetical protein
MGRATPRYVLMSRIILEFASQFISSSITIPDSSSSIIEIPSKGKRRKQYKFYLLLDKQSYKFSFY